MNEALSLISISDILELPPYVSIPGLIVIVLLIARGIRAFFTLRIIKAVSSFVLAFIVALILSRFGWAIVQMIDADAARQTSHLWNLPRSLPYTSMLIGFST